MPTDPSFSAGQRLDLKQLRVAVVDDNVQSLELVSQVLLGFRVRAIRPCRGASEALPLLNSEPMDLIIVDAEMPGQDGFSLIKDIRSRPDGPNFTAPIILTSGVTPLTKISRARDAGANLVVRKPIVPAILLGRITWLARSPRQFVNSPGYCGPDRRFQMLAPPEEEGERRAGNLKLIAQPERALSQDEINSLFD